MYEYISEKARLYLKLGPDRYRLADAFDRPDAGLGGEELELIASGCRQVLEGRGKTMDEPFTGLGIAGFNLLMELFHVRPLMQALAGATEEGLLDYMEMEHAVTGERLALYNLVPRRR